MRLVFATIGLFGSGLTAAADCDLLRSEYELRGLQRDGALRTIEEAGNDASKKCNYVARLAGIHVIRVKLSSGVSSCPGTPPSDGAVLAREKNDLEARSGSCPAFDAPRCSAIATNVLNRMAAELTQEIQGLSLDRKDRDETLKCKFAFAVTNFVLNATADFAAVDAHCPLSFGDDVEAAMLPVQIINARRVIDAQDKKMKPWVLRCK